MIENEQQFRFSVERLAKLYATRDHSESESHWSEEQRGSQVFQATVAIQELRREIAAYLDAQPLETFSSPMLEKYSSMCNKWEHEEASSSPLARAA